MGSLLASRPRMRLIGVLAATATLASAASAPAEGVEGLLAQIKKTYTTTPSVALTFVQTYTPAGFAAASPETGRLTLQAPDQVRFEYDGRDGKLFTFDGVAARQYVAADRQMVVKPLSASERSRLPLVFFESPERLLARYEAAVHPKQNGLTELVLTPKGDADPKSLTLLTTPDGEVKRLVVVDSGGNETAFTFTQKTPGKKRPPTDFALAPPQGTKVITE